MTESSSRKWRLWLGVPLAICLVGVGALAALGATGGLGGLFGASESRSSQVITSIAREQQVVLLSLGIQGIDKKGTNSELPFGIEIPGSERALFLQYSFKAKLGLEGGDVKIVPSGEHGYLITVPEFVFVGHSDEHFELISENGGLLSWLTPEIDQMAMVTTILNDEAQRRYISEHRELLQDQTRVFYTSIVQSIDPESTLTFDFGS
jgi:hypothetical protein